MGTHFFQWFLVLSAFFLEAALVVLLILALKSRRRLQKQNMALRKEREIIFEFVHQIGEVFADSDSVDMDTLLKRILFFATNTGKASAGAIYLFNTDRSKLFARSVSGVFPPLYDTQSINVERLLSKSKYLEKLVKERPVDAGEGLIGQAAVVGTGTVIEDAEIDARVPVYDEEFLRIRSLLVVPMRFGNEVLGVLSLSNRTDGQLFSPGDLTLLQAMADQACAPIHYAGLRDALEKKKQIDRDMHAAQQIQHSLLPQTLPQTEGVLLGAFNLPAYDIGGDYYDFIQIDEEHLGIAIADVSGKGIGGAMMMSVCQGVLRTRASQEQSPARMLSELNRVLSDNLAEDMFITMLYMVLNIRTRELKFARAGHERPLLCRQCNESHKPEPLNGAGIAIGLADNETFDSIIEDSTIQLGSGDGIIVYTDGITEALNEADEEWGLSNLTALVQTSRAETPNEFIENVRSEIARYVGAKDQYDDMTLLALRVT